MILLFTNLILVVIANIIMNIKLKYKYQFSSSYKIIDCNLKRLI